MKKFILIGLLFSSILVFINLHAITLSVTNNTNLRNCPLKVTQSGVTLGTVAPNSTQEFTVNLNSQINIQMLDFNSGTTSCTYHLSDGTINFQNDNTAVNQAIALASHSFCQNVTMTNNSGETVLTKSICSGGQALGTDGEYNIATTVTGA